MNVKIYVATHKPCNELLKIPYSYYIPIHCGKSIYNNQNKGFLPKLGDNTGDNISDQNPHYCELTAMYWIWKNDKSDPNDIVGLNHYRRYFSEDGKNQDFLTKETIIKKLNNYDFIVNGTGTPGHFELRDKAESVYESYKKIHIIQDLDNALIAIENLFPSIFPIIDNELKFSGSMCLCNLFITKKKFFDEYCEFLFPVLSYVNSTIDFKNDNKHQGYNGRVFGFLSERLFRPWLIAKNYKTINMSSLDWKHYVKKRD